MNHKQIDTAAREQVLSMVGLTLRRAVLSLRSRMLGSLHGIHPMRWSPDLAEALSERVADTIGAGASVYYNLEDGSIETCYPDEDPEFCCELTLYDLLFPK